MLHSLTAHDTSAYFTALNSATLTSYTACNLILLRTTSSNSCQEFRRKARIARHEDSLTNGVERRHRERRCENVRPGFSTSTNPHRPKNCCTFHPSPDYRIRVANRVCCSAASNAANSPLLRLPPEVRCRIYDYAFGSCVVHVNVGYKGSRHTLTNCSSPQKCEAPLLQRRIQRIIKSSYPYNATWWHLEVCRKPSNRQVTCKIPVHMMQVC